MFCLLSSRGALWVPVRARSVPRVCVPDEILKTTRSPPRVWLFRPFLLSSVCTSSSSHLRPTSTPPLDQVGLVCDLLFFVEFFPSLVPPTATSPHAPRTAFFLAYCCGFLCLSLLARSPCCDSFPARCAVVGVLFPSVCRLRRAAIPSWGVVYPFHGSPFTFHLTSTS